MKSYLAAVRHGQIAMGLGDPLMAAMPRLLYILKGTRRNLAGRPQRTHLPITPSILQILKTSWDHLLSRGDAVMPWAASTLCFFAFLRMGEAVTPSDSAFDARYHLAYGDVRVNSRVEPAWMEVVIKRSSLGVE